MKIAQSGSTHRSRIARAVAIVAAFAVFSPQAFAGGYEKTNMFSGKWSGAGGAAASSVSGSESLFFNPAGLAAGEGMGDVSLNFSPSFLKFTGPLAGNASVDSTTAFSPGYGVFAGYKINEKWGVAIGSYLSGGSRVTYEAVNFTNAPTVFGAAADTDFAGASADIKSQLSVIEFSVGTGYEIIDGLRLGLAYRMAMVHAALSSYGYNPLNNTLSVINLDNISGNSWNGWRIGLQYYPKESRWGLGATWRSAVAFSGTGDITGSTTLGTTTGPIPAGTKVDATAAQGTVSNVFPQQFQIGGHFDIIPSSVRALLQYDYINYSVNQRLALTGTVAFPTLGQSQALSGIEQNWINQHTLRVGAECFEVANWIFRAGYTFGSQVTPRDRARPTFSPPGSGHTVALGAGTSFLENKLETNVALEYGFASGTVTAEDVPPATRDSGIAGDYSAKTYAGHLSARYRF